MERPIAVHPAHPEREASLVNDQALTGFCNLLYADQTNSRDHIDTLKQSYTSYLSSQGAGELQEVLGNAHLSPMSHFGFKRARAIAKEMIESNPSLVSENAELCQALTNFVISDNFVIYPRDRLKIYQYLVQNCPLDCTEEMSSVCAQYAAYIQTNQPVQHITARQERFTTHVTNGSLFIATNTEVGDVVVEVPNYIQVLEATVHYGILDSTMPLGLTPRLHLPATTQVLTRVDSTNKCKKKHTFFFLSKKKRGGKERIV